MDKEKTVFLVLDCENDLLDEKGTGAGFGIPQHAKQVGVVDNIAKVLSKARESGVDVMYVTVTYEKNGMNLKDSKMPIHDGVKQGAELAIKGSWGAKIPEKIQPMEGEQVFNKSMISPFTINGFEEALSKYSTVIMAGVATNFVVESAAREAADRFYEVIVLKDCCATMNQEMQEASFNVLAMMAQLKTSEEICEEL